jgi:glycosyltransferase EpsJ
MNISVIVPAYNSAFTIEKCVSSVLAQTYADLELVIVDDGSKDDTYAICRTFAQNDSRVKLIHQDNKGVSEARNAALRAATGKYIAFVDADDWLDTGAYEKMMSALTKHNADCAACGHWLAWPDGTMNFGSAPMDTGFYTAEETRERIVLPLLNDRLSKTAFNGFAVRYLYNRESLLKRNIKFTGTYLEDELFLIEFFSYPTTLAVVNEGLYYYYQNPASATRRYMAHCVDTFMRSVKLKKELVSRFALNPGPDWLNNTLWSGLLIAIGNEFAPGNEVSFVRHVKNLRDLCRGSEFGRAIKDYTPSGMGRNKAVVANFVRKRMYGSLSLLYKLKNRGRK